MIPSRDEAPLTLQAQTLGPQVQFGLTIPAGRWFAAKPLSSDGFALVSCVVAPGFLFEDFELATRHQLVGEGCDKLKQWPLIESLLIQA